MRLGVFNIQGEQGNLQEFVQISSIMTESEYFLGGGTLRWCVGVGVELNPVHETP